ncbi:hypothetical protein CA85_41400 [Allorhodopirellula solitaria]|uniref:Uncharacterized protein n=1 Tax=Allorhodopirellula solitaria TaxID=2527987 RepID=A0A5C5X0Y4_9BACT|nr:hypothetical protein CA85_41400 [Allorhodopirellula solitaria]
MPPRLSDVEAPGKAIATEHSRTGRTRMFRANCESRSWIHQVVTLRLHELDSHAILAFVDDRLNIGGRFVPVLFGN